MKLLFALGKVTATPRALRVMRTRGIDGWELLRRHVSGDWGDLDEADKRGNEVSLKESFAILSAYGKGANRICIITDADRSATTWLLPDEY
jgi:hypothetical protein